MEVVVAFAHGEQVGPDVIDGCNVFVVIFIAGIVSKRVDEEGAVKENGNANDTADPEAAQKITPTEAANEGREEEAAGKGKKAIIVVEEHDNAIGSQIRNVDLRHFFRSMLLNGPALVTPPKALRRIVWIFRRVHISMVRTMISRPHQYRPLKRTTRRQKDPKPPELVYRKGTMRKQPMVPTSDTYRCPKVKDTRKY